eukprot:TRINITY_DN32533_c0_g1_i1.p1 TRINITY_DN32533_c0_g1~~TRINITY_DN32533_c0_g1_i1.p1  ORF type:complete len:118 (-),score=34.59 TRINITY_DN32533_c0_g1_i1:166-519(-)
MLRSLVGSEMCIRDSPQPVVIDPREAARAAALRRLAATSRPPREDATTNHNEDTQPITNQVGDTSVFGVSSSTSWKRYPLPGMEPVVVPHVAAMEGVASVADMYGFLLECEKQYTEW